MRHDEALSSEFIFVFPRWNVDGGGGVHSPTIFICYLCAPTDCELLFAHLLLDIALAYYRVSTYTYFMLCCVACFVRLCTRYGRRLGKRTNGVRGRATGENLSRNIKLNLFEKCVCVCLFGGAGMMAWRASGEAQQV